MAVVIRMKRTGRKNRPSYRISATNSRNARDGRTLETLGIYDPASPVEALRLKLVPERIQYWVSQGARVSPMVAAILRKQKIVPPKVKKPRDRADRKKPTKAKASRAARKKTMVEAKAARFKARVAAKKAAAKAAAPAEGAST
jgi:small subunit ribosomal protein S16